jgi:hypothetical protein
VGASMGKGVGCHAVCLFGVANVQQAAHAIAILSAIIIHKFFTPFSAASLVRSKLANREAKIDVY